MARGGKRSGAGRKAGSANRKTREIADQAAAEGITPLEVMLTSMRKLYAAEELTAACSIAKDAAPYMHPRLNTTTLDANVSLLGSLTLDDKRALLAALATFASGEEGAGTGAETRH